MWASEINKSVLVSLRGLATSGPASIHVPLKYTFPCHPPPLSHHLPLLPFMPHQNAGDEASQKMDLSSSLSPSFSSSFPRLTSILSRCSRLSRLGHFDHPRSGSRRHLVVRPFYCFRIAFSHLYLSSRRSNASYSKWLFFFVRYFAVAMEMYPPLPFVIPTTHLPSPVLFSSSVPNIPSAFTIPKAIASNGISSKRSELNSSLPP